MLRLPTGLIGTFTASACFAAISERDPLPKTVSSRNAHTACQLASESESESCDGPGCKFVVEVWKGIARHIAWRRDTKAVSFWRAVATGAETMLQRLRGSCNPSTMHPGVRIPASPQLDRCRRALELCMPIVSAVAGHDWLVWRARTIIARLSSS